MKDNAVKYVLRYKLFYLEHGLLIEPSYRYGWENAKFTSFNSPEAAIAALEELQEIREYVILQVLVPTVEY